MIRGKVTGAVEIAAKLRVASEQLVDAVGVAIHEEAIEIMRDARDRAPVGETGELRDSGFVSEPDGARVELGFGANHAIVVHERTDLHHDDGEAKFLQRAIDERSAGMAERITERTVEQLEAQAVDALAGDFPAEAPPDRPRVRKGRAHRIRAAATRNRRR